MQETRTATIEIARGADFYHVCINGRPDYPCSTEAEAFEIAFYIAERDGVDFIMGPLVETIRRGAPMHVRTCYEWVGGKWEGFVSMIGMTR